MDASTAAVTAANLFGNIEQKFDLATLLRNVTAAAAAASNNNLISATTVANIAPGSTATSPNSVESSAPSSSTSTTLNGIASNGLVECGPGGGGILVGGTRSSSSPSPPIPTSQSIAEHQKQQLELKPIPASSLAPPGVVRRRELPFTPIKPVYAPSGHGRQILVYESRAYPGCRREFAYKTRFTNQSGLTTVYFRCMACRALRHRLQRSLPKERLPAVPCIAVKNELLINDPDFPEASDHFCTPLTIDESNQRLRNNFERGHKRSRMKMASSAVEETIRKVGKLRAAEQEEEENSADHILHRSSVTLDGSECSSDSIVDVMHKDEEFVLERAYAADGCTSMSFSGRPQHQARNESNDNLGNIEGKELIEKKEAEEEEEQLEKEVNEKREKRNGDKFTENTKMETTNLPTSTSDGMLLSLASSSGGSASATVRSPCKKLDSLLKMAEMRAAAANIVNGGENLLSEHKKIISPKGRSNGISRRQATTAPQTTPTTSSVSSSAAAAPLSANANSNNTPTLPVMSPLSIQQLSSLLSASQQQQQKNNQIAASIQGIHAIAARLNRGGTTDASEMNKVLTGIKCNNNNTVSATTNSGKTTPLPPPQYASSYDNNNINYSQQQQQHLVFFNGAGCNSAVEKVTQQLQQQFLNGGAGAHQQQQNKSAFGPHMTELIRKYVENNVEFTAAQLPISAETLGMGSNSRSAGDLACALFMAQMVENAELRQEVAKLRGELDSLKAVFAAAVVVQNNGNGTNGGGGGMSGGHHTNGLHHHGHRQQQAQQQLATTQGHR